MALVMLSDIPALVGAFLSGLFVVLAARLLLKYRRLSAQANSSVELGKDLLDAMEKRLRKQDERILDVMARLDVIQSRLEGQTARGVVAPVTQDAEITTLKVAGPPVVAGQEISARGLDPTELAALKVLSERPRTSNEVNGVIKKSREHMARLMKGLYGRGLVSRDDSKKPFVYQLTDEGRRYLSAS